MSEHSLTALPSQVTTGPGYRPDEGASGRSRNLRGSNRHDSFRRFLAVHREVGEGRQSTIAAVHEAEVLRADALPVFGAPSWSERQYRVRRRLLHEDLRKMPRVMPTEAVRTIRRLFPGIGRHNVLQTYSLGNANELRGIINLVKEVPSELIVLPEDVYANMILATSP